MASPSYHLESLESPSRRKFRFAVLNPLRMHGGERDKNHDCMAIRVRTWTYKAVRIRRFGTNSTVPQYQHVGYPAHANTRK